MPIKITGIHHHAVRIEAAGDELGRVRDFYTGVLGLATDDERPDFASVPGWWIDVGDSGQIHLIGGPNPSPFTQAPGQDPAGAHVALGVESIAEAKAELERMGVKHWTLFGATGPESQQVFVYDPAGNMIELHQHDTCRCAPSSRQG